VKCLDLVIVGAGPGGMTAGIYAARKKMDFIMVTRDIGGQAILSSDIENYLGYQFITGVELVKKFREHVEYFNLEIRENEPARVVQKEGDFIRVETEKSKYFAKTVIVASGRVPRELGVKGEKEFKNRGVTYCATCDAPLFAGKDVAVIGGGNAGLDAVLQLIKIARKIFLLEFSSRITGDAVMLEKIKRSGKVEIYTETRVEEIYGNTFVKGLRVRKGEQVKEIEVEGVFVEIGSKPASGFVKEVKKNEKGEIIINPQCETSVPGIFAAGDVTNVFGKQIIVACGEGAKAALAAFLYLGKKAWKKEG